MALILKSTQKTPGTHKMKLGQLMTLNGHIYQCVKYRLDYCKCKSCVFDRDDLWAESYVACRLCDLKGIFKLIK